MQCRLNEQLRNIASIIQNIVSMYLNRGRVYDKEGCPKNKGNEKVKYNILKP